MGEKGEKRKGWSREGEVTEGMGGTGQDMGWGGKGKDEGEGKGGEGLQPPNFNSWCCHCFLGMRL